MIRHLLIGLGIWIAIAVGLAALWAFARWREKRSADRSLSPWCEP